MTTLDTTTIAVLIVVFGIPIGGPVRNSKAWSATVTRLSSIVGSGFLVSVPLLASAIGIWAVAAVVGLTFLAYPVGGAIRYNIANGEPIFDTAEAGHTIESIETLSRFGPDGRLFHLGRVLSGSAVRLRGHPVRTL